MTKSHVAFRLHDGKPNEKASICGPTNMLIIIIIMMIIRIIIIIIIMIIIIILYLYRSPDSA